MLLRRMMDHVQSQNWLAVFLDFVIVVVGVYIGIQLGNWNEASSNSQRKAAALESLQTEFESNIRRFDQIIESYAETLVREAIVSNAVFAGRLAEKDRAQFETGLARSMYFGPLAVDISVYEVLEQSGDLSLIDDQEILVALNDFNRSLDWTNDQRQSFREGITDLGREWRDYVYHTPTDDPHATAVVYDFEALIADRRATGALIEVSRMKHIFFRYVPPLKERAIAVCKRLAEETGRPCEVASAEIRG